MSHADEEKRHARDVLAELRGIEADIESLVEAVGDTRHFSPERTEELRGALKLLKERLQRGAATGTASGDRRVPSRVEATFFQPAVSKASAFIGLRTNSRPGPEWMDKLYGISVDIGHAAADLQQWIDDSENE